MGLGLVPYNAVRRIWAARYLPRNWSPLMFADSGVHCYEILRKNEAPHVKRHIYIERETFKNFI